MTVGYNNYSFIICPQKLQRQLEFLEVQEEYIKDEQKNLKKEYLHAQEEVKRIQSVPLVIGQFLEAVDQNTGIVGSTTGMHQDMIYTEYTNLPLFLGLYRYIYPTVIHCCLNLLILHFVF